MKIAFRPAYPGEMPVGKFFRMFTGETGLGPVKGGKRAI